MGRGNVTEEGAQEYSGLIVEMGRTLSLLAIR